VNFSETTYFCVDVRKESICQFYWNTLLLC